MTRRRPFGSVRARATLAASCVVAVALLAAGAALVLSLRANLVGQADTQAESAARRVASQLAAGIAYARLDWPDEEDHPVAVEDERGRTVAAGEDLRAVDGTPVHVARTAPTAPTSAQAPTPSAAGTGSGSAGSAGSSGRSGSSGSSDDDGSGDDSDDHGGGRTDDHGGGRSDDHGGGRDDDGSTGRDQADQADGKDETDDDPAVGEISDDVTHTVGTATVDDGTRDYRFAALEVTTPGDVTLTVRAGAPLDAERGAVNTALTTLSVGLPLLLLTVAGVTWLVTRRALRPVEDIRVEMAAITASEDLARRVPVPGTGDEVARLARTTNRTLTALEASVERQRRFVADASHELRSPLASLRTQLEVGAAHPALLDVDGAVEDTVRLQHLAADLLLLARLDAGERPGDARVPLDTLAREAARGRKGVVVEETEEAEGASAAEGAEGVAVVGSRGQLARVLANLLDNAARHARQRVTVTVRREGGHAVLSVADDGPGIPADQRERVFERFVRLDDARARDDGGTGLGLAIARDIARRHGGTLTATEAPGGGALLTLRLPTADQGLSARTRAHGP
ncbi:HAMP domain-containing sensor histidine kinase [Streptomyces sp. B3I8]|uniref:sensor histidine kinase n=1 Tax=Streptomyces sp. B3I8 TaxID=3042303 RepID=UPI0027807142|nr:HAMP domain-containing sensor histidine kinase [Streptomyces sp. B3I8]MDQ0789265.1 signal transduction histidine kinase [Streptomyces sp. B3I8]